MRIGPEELGADVVVPHGVIPDRWSVRTAVQPAERSVRPAQRA
jgi:hypothetical protein